MRFDAKPVQLGVRWLKRLRKGLVRRAAAEPRPTFATAAEGLELKAPFEISHPERIHLGRDVKLGPNSVLKVHTEYPGGWSRHPEGRHVTQRFDAEIRLGDRVISTGGLHLAAFTSITVEEDVLFASNVFLGDGTHATTRGDVPYKYQGIGRVAPITVGRGAWLGQNVVVLPGVRIGAFAVIGANAVVTRDVPDGCIAMGSPARVVRHWDPDTERWLDADPATAEVPA